MHIEQNCIDLALNYHSVGTRVPQHPDI